MLDLSQTRIEAVMKTFSLIFAFLFSLIIQAQVAIEMPAPPYIKTVQFYGNTAQSQLPLIQLGTPLRLSFDDIIGDESDFYYTITHYNYDWTPSVLVKNEYIDGVDDVRIMNYTNSVSTLQLYTHYELTIPNQYTTGITKTGNYLLEIFNENEELIFSRKFMIYNPMVSVGAEVLRSRDLNFIEEKQVVNFFIDSGENVLVNPKNTVKTLIIQNNNLKNTITGPEPQYSIGNRLEYRYNDELSFYAGNEFFDYDNKNIRSATNRIQFVDLQELYHNYLYGNVTRSDREYTYNPDINGNFVVRTMQGSNPNIHAEYAWIHFSLDHPQRPDGEEVYIYGNFNNYDLEDATRMYYNADNGRYETALLMKQGYYNYKYVVAKNGQKLSKNPISGDFWETENEYDVLVYYRPPGARFDELVGAGKALSTSISNVRRE